MTTHPSKPLPKTDPVPETPEEPILPMVTLTSEENGKTMFRRLDLKTSFSVPAHPNVSQQLEYFSRYADTRLEPMYLRLWHSALTILVDWQCESLPDPKADLTTLTDPSAANVIMWVGQAVLSFMDELEALPKDLSRTSSS